MSFPSLISIKNQLLSIHKRFPCTLAITLLATVAGILKMGQDYYMAYGQNLVEPSIVLTNILITSVLGFLVFLAVELRIQREEKFGLWFRIIALSFLVAYFFLLPQNYDSGASPYVLRTILYSLSAIMAVTLTPFLFKKEINGFWHHCKKIFIRIFFTGVFTGTLFLGLVLAFYGINYLLGIHIDESVIFQLWIFIIGFIAVPFFLAGFPEDLSSLEKQKDYPKSLEIFAQYILLPLFFVYTLILYAYAIKILYVGQWPQSQVIALILVFAIAGFLAYFLLYPLRNDKNNTWVVRISKLIFLLIIPMVAMLFGSIYLRLIDYGLTINRYFAIVSGFWILFMAGYFLLSKKQNLKFIPSSLFLILILSSFGPWGATQLPETNQLNRLQSTLEENGLLLKGKIVKLPEGKNISSEDNHRITSALGYLYRYHDLNDVKPWFDKAGLEPECLKEYYCLIEEGMGLNPAYYGDLSGDSYSSFYPDDQDMPYSNFSVEEVTGYDYVINDLSYYKYGYEEGAEGDLMSLKNETLTIHSKEFDTIEIDLSDLIDRLAENPSLSNRPQSELIVENEKAKLILNGIDLVNLTKPDRTIQSIYGMLLIKK